MFVLKEDKSGNRAFFNLDPRPDVPNRSEAVVLPLEGQVKESIFLKTAEGVERPVVTRHQGGKDFLGLDKKGAPVFKSHDRTWFQYHIGSPIVVVCFTNGVARVEADWSGLKPGDQLMVA